MLLRHVLLEEPKDKWQPWSKQIKRVTKSRIKHKKRSILYYCTDETKPPSQTTIPECTQCARHRKYSLYYTYNMYIFEPIHKTKDAKTGSISQPRGAPILRRGAHSLSFHLPVDTSRVQQCVCTVCPWPSRTVLTNYAYFYFCFSRLKALQRRQVISFNGVGRVRQGVRLQPVIYFAVTVCLG